MTEFEKNRVRDENGKTKADRWREKNRYQQTEYEKAWAQKNPEKVAEYAARKIAAHKAKRAALAGTKVQCLRCESEVKWPEDVCETCRHKSRMVSGRKRTNSNPKYREKSLRQYYKRKALVGVGGANNKITPEFMGWVYGCAWCGDKESKLTVDHIIPISVGGAHHFSNILFACGRCNCTRTAKSKGTSTDFSSRVYSDRDAFLETDL